MGVFSKMVSLQLMLFTLIAVGIALRKLGFIDGKGRKLLSDLLINVILPCNIIQSFTGGVRPSGAFMRNCLLMLLLSSAIQVLVYLLNRPLFRRFPEHQSRVLCYGMICSNSTFVGLPVAETLFGDLGVMYTAMFQIPLRFTMWTAGLSLFTSVSKKDAFRKLVRHPCIVAVFLGLALMCLPLNPVPGFVMDSVVALNRCTTPVSMLVIGSILADAPLKSLFSPSVLYYSALRLLAFPLLVWGLMLPLPMDGLLKSICLLMTAMPAGSTTSILADRYGCDAAFAAQLVFVSTLLSIATIPLLTLLV